MKSGLSEVPPNVAYVCPNSKDSLVGIWPLPALPIKVDRQTLPV